MGEGFHATFFALLALGLRVIFAYALHNTALFGYTAVWWSQAMAWTVTLPCLLCARVPRQMEEQISDLIGRHCDAAPLFALISRMRYIGRWGLMRNTFEENIQEHSHMVAVLAHGLAVIQRDILGQPADPDRCASAALFHDASEILTGDLPTPIKYYNPEIKKGLQADRGRQL